MTKSFVPLPEIPFIFVKVSANFTTKPFAFFVVSFSTRILVPASAVVVTAVGLKFAPPLMVNSSFRLRCTLFPSSPLKSIPELVNSVFAASTVVFV